MIGTLVRQLSDGEELVIERLPPRSLVDPRERTIEARRLALDDDNDLPERGH
jgi:hypothetical protein